MSQHANKLGSGSSASHELASWLSRVRAYLIDILVLLLGLLVVGGVAEVVWDPLFFVVVAVWFVLFFLGYWVYFEGSESGQTLGKRALKIRVRDDQGGRASYGQAFGRNLVARVVVFFPFVGLLDTLWPLWDTKKQCPAR